MSAGHASAFFRTVAALFGAPPAMLGFVFAAFGSACFAYLGAYAANIVRELRTAAHGSCGRPTHLGAIAIQPDAIRHHRYVVLAQA
jgi:hypothetical protein